MAFTSTLLLLSNIAVCEDDADEDLEYVKSSGLSVLYLLLVLYALSHR